MTNGVLKVCIADNDVSWWCLWFMPVEVLIVLHTNFHMNILCTGVLLEWLLFSSLSDVIYCLSLLLALPLSLLTQVDGILRLRLTE